MTFEERMDALTMNLELMSHQTEESWKQIAALKSLIEIDADNIRRLANIAQAHEERLSDGGL